MNRRVIAIAAVIALLFPVQALAEDDPFPGLSYGDKIPGTEITSPRNMSSDDWYASDAYVNLVCPSGSQKGTIISTRPSTGRVHKTWCWKNYRSPAEDAARAAQEEYQRAIDAAQKAAEEESRRWNEANPGKQKCVQWGPITGPNGEQSSGGVCANPVPAGTAPSGSETVEAPSVGEGDSSSSSSVSPSVSAPVSSGTDPDPTPPAATVNYRGSGHPFTTIVEGSVGKSGCPSGFQEANGLIVDVSTGKRYTECWPTRAWTAYRLGGEAWELFKSTGGSYDPTVEVARKAKVELLFEDFKAG